MVGAVSYTCDNSNDVSNWIKSENSNTRKTETCGIADVTFLLLYADLIRFFNVFPAEVYLTSTKTLQNEGDLKY